MITPMNAESRFHEIADQYTPAQMRAMTVAEYCETVRRQVEALEYSSDTSRAMMQKCMADEFKYIDRKCFADGQPVKRQEKPTMIVNDKGRPERNRS